MKPIHAVIALPLLALPLMMMPVPVPSAPQVTAAAPSVRSDRAHDSDRASRSQVRKTVAPKPKAKVVKSKPKAIKPKHKKKRVSQTVKSVAPNTGSNRRVGRSMAAKVGWTGVQWTCLNNLWTRESGWSTHSSNSSGTAWGIPQALPGSKMASKGSDWRTNPRTQIRWGIGYIKGRYGLPCKAWAHYQAHSWY